MKKILKFLPAFALFFNTMTLYASSYDNDVLGIFAKVLPRFIFMSNQKQNIGNQIQICIIHEQVDKVAALSLIRKIKSNYPNGLESNKLNLLQTDFLHINRCAGSKLIFLLNASQEHVSDAVSYAKTQHAMTVSYDNTLLANGVEISLFLGRRIVPYVNITAVKRNDIKLDNVLLRISKIYMEMDK